MPTSPQRSMQGSHSRIAAPEHTEKQFEYVCTSESTEFIALNSWSFQKTAQWLRSDNSNQFQSGIYFGEENEKGIKRKKTAA